ncbi:MAG TPA: sensor histidine kinase [Ktedonobacterales bacterium]
MEPSHITSTDENTRNVSPYLLWGIWLMWLPFLIQPLTALLQMPPSLQKGAAAFGFALFVATYLWATWQEAFRLTRASPLGTGLDRRSLAPIGVLIALSVILPFVQGAWGLGGFIYSSATVAGRLTVRRAALVFCGLMLLVLILGVLTSAPWATIALMLFLIPAVGATTASFSRVFRTNRELRQARREIARLAVSEERLRFARDLHDLLGHTLSLIALKSELAGQLIPEDPAQAQREVHDIEAAARTALQEVREAVAGYRQSTLASELQRAQEVLAAAGIACTIHNDAGSLPTPIETQLTWVVREGITNVIRHSRAQHCILSLTRQPDEIRLTITDDGQGGSPQQVTPSAHADASGHGLRGIAERVTALDGHAEAGPAGDRGFQLAVTIPLSAPRGKHALAAQYQQSDQTRGTIS